jgi:hypothetical protein
MSNTNGPVKCVGMRFPNDNTTIPSPTAVPYGDWHLPVPQYPAPCLGCGRCPVCGRGPNTAFPELPKWPPTVRMTWSIDGSPEVQPDVHTEGSTTAADGLASD